METFNKMCDWLEMSADELVTIDDLVSKCKSLTNSSESVYSSKWIKWKLTERYGDHIFFAPVEGRRDVVCFRDMASFILNDKWYSERKDSVADDAVRIVVAAAKLLVAAIKETNFLTAVYPSSNDILSSGRCIQWMPDLLQVFVQALTKNEIKQASLGHGIVQLIRPQTCIAPLQFGLAVSVYHVFGSKWLLTLLNRLGFSSSYDEILRFRQAAAQCTVPDLPHTFPESFTQFSADNVDHNICTIDGNDTFHGMGILSMSIPTCISINENSHKDDMKVPRLPRQPSVDVPKNLTLAVWHYESYNAASLSSVTFVPLQQLVEPLTLPACLNWHLWWHISGLIPKLQNARPNWSGFMHDVTAFQPSATPHTQVADVRMCPVVDMSPSDPSCIYSTMVYVIECCASMHVETPCITFDQPLWQKAINIAISDKMNIVIRLGPFHILMSFLASIGTFMAGSGLADALGCCYAANSVTHMLSGKAVSRALRGHFLVDSALSSLLLKTTLTDQDIEDLSSAYEERIRSPSASTYSYCTIDDDAFRSIQEKLCAVKSELCSKSRTAHLWIAYMRCVDIVKTMITAERTSNWHLHLASVYDMLAVFAATGHHNYVRCGRLYLQLMMNLRFDHPWLYDRFATDGMHAVRRSDRYWTALSTDLMIEQVMMKAVKGRGGLTRGRGMTDSVRALWVGSMHQCATIHSAIDNLTKIEPNGDDHHLDTRASRILRDNSDQCKILSWLESRNPFDISDSRLRCLTTGLASSGADGINCDNVFEVGQTILEKMDGRSFTDVVVRKSDTVRMLSSLSSSMSAPGKSVAIDPNVLFNRLLIIMSRSADVKEYFQYELSTEPCSLFSNNMMRKAPKAQLKNELLRCELDSQVVHCAELHNSVYVIDGGYLLHAVKWLQDGTYEQVANQYIDYVGKHYGRKTAVVFDGYGNGPSIKDHEHFRRHTKTKTHSPDVVFRSDMAVAKNQAAFLSNENNKKAFVSYLMACLQQSGHETYQAHDDADTLVVQTALDKARLFSETPVTVIANDTDIMILLIYHYDGRCSKIFMKSHVKKKSALADSTIIPIHLLRQAIGEQCTRSLLAIHAFSGCDSTSGTFGHSKVAMWKKFTNHHEAAQLLNILSNVNATQDMVAEVGCKLMAVVYGGKLNTSLTSLRYSSYMNMTAKSTHLPKPERLPPTESAAKFHAFRSHLQVIHWKTLSTTSANAEEWGWKEDHGRLVPVAMDLKAAPDDLLNVVRCKCHCDKSRPCGTALCSCVKHGLKCVSACKNCQGASCENSDNDCAASLSEADDDLEVPAEVLDDDLECFLPWVWEEVCTTTESSLD